MAKIVSRSALVFGVALIILSVLLISLNPAVDEQGRPSAQDLQGAQQIWHQLNLARGGTATEVRADDGMVSGMAALAGDALGVTRLDARLSHGELQGRASIPLPLGLWLNASAAATGSHDGFPLIALKVGHLSFPDSSVRLIADLARLALRLKGAETPPLDDVVRRFTVTDNHVIAKVIIPPRRGLVEDVLAVQGGGINYKMVETTFCRIAAAQRATPTRSLSQLVRQTFRGAPLANPEDQNRASFIALSLAVVGDQAEAFVADAPEMRRRCPFPNEPILLQGRADLAKHWTLSAALTSVFGGEAAKDLGEWKELQDSLKGGSGFSFVDLAADRAGLHMALAGSTPETAVRTRQKLSRASDEYILPRRALRAPEGLSEGAFADRFGSLDQKEYRRAVLQIDNVLRRQRVQEPSE